jgi:hypothetical protein
MMWWCRVRGALVMKQKLLLRVKYVVVACVLALTGGTANAATYQVSGAYWDFSGTVYPCNPPSAQCPGVPPSVYDPNFHMDLQGTLTFANGVLTNANLRLTNPPFNSFFFPLPFPSQYSVSPDEQNWSISINETESGPLYILKLVLAYTAGALTGSLDETAQPGIPGVLDGFVVTSTNFIGTVSTVPLPAALPLFATGLGALGLLGWRRKRKAAA